MKYIFIVPLLLCSVFLAGQHIKVEYSSVTNSDVYSCSLVIADSVSVWNDYSPSTISSTETAFMVKDYSSKNIYYNDAIFNQFFYIKDSLHSMTWELTGETILILDENCFSAKTNFRGRNYTAYYAPSFSLSDGPWKFGGLPGLILVLKSDDNIFQYSAVKIIKNFTGKPGKSEINKHKYISWVDYVKIFTATIDNYVKLVRSNGTLEDGNKAKLKITAPEIIYPKAQTGDGIEF